MAIIDLLTIISAIACIAGLGIIFGLRQRPGNEAEANDEYMFAAVFTYWLVHCLTVGLMRMDWQGGGEVWALSLKMLSALTYFVTWASVLCLPLQRISVREME
jgi:hypothetical protein